VCGIVGVVGPGGRELVSQLVGGLAHRGPDDEGIWSDERVALGHRRLAIIGLDPAGAQPRVSRSGASVISFNGEIYNELADELETAGRRVDRRFDTDVLIEALEEWGVGALERLNGMFAFAWYRPGQRRLLLARDRWGKKPLFWGRWRSRVVFGSELRVFAGLPGGPPPADPLGVARYLAYDGMPGERTVYRDVAKVGPASWIELDASLEGHERRGRYWRFARRPEPMSEAEAIDELDRRLETSLALRLRSDVPVGLFLSGGIDSSLLAATWRRIRPGDTIRTFTAGFDDPSYDESGPARAMAEHVGAEHTAIPVTENQLVAEIDRLWDHLSEPFADPSIIPTALICRVARERVTVALGGEGGDELAAGYDPFRAWTPSRWAERIIGRAAAARLASAIERRLPVDDRNLSLRFKLHHFAQGMARPVDERVSGWMAGFVPEQALEAMDPDLAREVDADEIYAPSRDAYRRAAGAGELAAQIAVWIETYLEACILVKIDRASMMSSLEVRAPLLDPGVADLLARVPDDLLFRRNRGKRLLRRLAERRVPAGIARRPKKGFGVPQSRWLRTVLRPRMETCLDRARSGGWFGADAIETMWRDHLAGRAEHRRALWAFLFSFPFQR
jgi:asparagine synthase (glutamine-hydrolysing)